MITFFLDLYDQIYDFFFSTDFNAALLIIKLIGYSLSILLAVLAGVLLSKSSAGWWLHEAARARDFAYGGPENKKWKKIQDRLKKGDEANLKLAVIEADNIFDEILKRMGLPGKDMGERLKEFQKHELSSIDFVWEAHRLRNLIVHEPSVHVTYEQAETAIKYYETALKELEYL